LWLNWKSIKAHDLPGNRPEILHAVYIHLSLIRAGNPSKLKPDQKEKCENEGKLQHRQRDEDIEDSRSGTETAREDISGAR